MTLWFSMINSQMIYEFIKAEGKHAKYPQLLECTWIYSTHSGISYIKLSGIYVKDNYFFQHCFLVKTLKVYHAFIYY